LKQRKDGRYILRITLADGKKKDILGYTQNEVKQKASEILKLSEQGIIVDDKTTMDNWHDKWFSTYKSNLAHNTQQMYLYAYKHIQPLLGSLPIKKIKPINVQMVMNTVADGSESLQHKVLITLQQLFDTAVQNNLILKSPCMGIGTVKHQMVDKIKTLSEQQQFELLEAAKGTRAYLFVAIGLYAGLRREETLGLMWDDINLETNRIKVNRSLTFIHNQPHVSDNLKTKAARREIPIQPPLYEILKNAERKALYVVVNTHNEPMSEISYTNMWNTASKKVNFHCSSHMLRHTYCTTLHKMGIDLKMAQHLMGHANIQMTAKIYTHIENCQMQSAEDKMRAYYINQANCEVN
jgi:integrase